ncbi:MAG: TonB-dependent receptor [Chitinophagaceae bacterium]|nr:TonB-dependent receptor [Chitinophagaceae bacterium]
MRINSSAFLFFVFFCSLGNSQTVALKIIVKTSSKDSAPNTTVQLYSLPDTVLVQSQVSVHDTTSFSVNGFSHYLIKASAIGFETKQKDIVLADSPVLLSFQLNNTNSILKGVTIVSKKKLLQQEDDKTIVDAEALANSSTNAYEVLEKTPGAVVDQDGNVYLNSTTPASIYINGREMKMSADDIASLLKSLPAGSVSKIEILRTPSAKYDAANGGGIVNVVLKKGIRIGSTGGVNVRLDQGVYNTVSAGFNVNSSAGKINSWLSYQYTDRNYYEEIHSSRIINKDTLLEQISSTTYSPVTHYVGGGLDMAVNKKFNIGYDIRLTANRNSSFANSSNLFRDLNTQNNYLQSITPISNQGNSLFIANTISSKYKIDSLGSEWTNEINYTYSNNNNLQLYTNNYLLPSSPSLYGDGNIHTSGDMVNFKSDGTLKLKYQFVLETGIKLSYAANKNQALYYTQKGNDPKQLDAYQTNTFKYKESINAAYVQLSRSIYGFVLKSGLRYENTNITGNQFVPTDTSFSINRNDLFPYIYLKRYLFKIFGYPLTGNAIYRRSITRPSYDALNPSPKFVDPFTYDAGNSKLRPQFTTNYELNATYNDFPVFAIGVNDTKDIFSRVTYQDDVTKTVYRTYDNLGKNKEIYGRLFGGLPAGHKYFMYAGVQYNYIQYRGSYQQLPLNYNRGSWTFFTGHELKVTPTLRFNVNAWMYVNGFRAFNELKNMGQLNASITKTLLKKKLSIILSGNDILKTNKSTFHLQQGNVLATGTRVQDSRRVGITLRYNFGITHKEEKKPVFNQQPVEPGESN